MVEKLDYIPDWCEIGLAMALPDDWTWYICHGCGEQWGASASTYSKGAVQNSVLEHTFCTTEEIDICTGEPVGD